MIIVAMAWTMLVYLIGWSVGFKRGTADERQRHFLTPMLQRMQSEGAPTLLPGHYRPAGGPVRMKGQG
jgi:hypothetical protein